MNSSLYKALINSKTELLRDGRDISSYLSDVYNNYVLSLESATGRDYDDVRAICSEIVYILNQYRNGKTVDAYQHAYTLFEKISRYLRYINVYQKSINGYYRIRPGRFTINQRTELFHIPYSMQNLIRAYRYSIAGQPCLYASSDIRQAWMECGMPREFSYVQLKIEEQPDSQAALRLIDFTRDIKKIIDSKAQIEKERKINIDQVIENYIYSYPLRAACSLIVKNKDDNYIAEYIIPQLLMQWIRDNKRFDGIKYKPNVYNSLKKNADVYNIALITSDYREDGLDRNLTAKIKVSNVEVVNLVRSFSEYQSKVDSIERIADELKVKLDGMNRKNKELYYIIDLCDVFVWLFRRIQNGEYSDQDTELVFHFIDTINAFRNIIFSNKNVIADKAHSKSMPVEDIEHYIDSINYYLNSIMKDEGLFFDHIKTNMRKFEYI